MMDAAPALTLAGVVRRYRQGETTLDILRGVDLQLWPGQSVALVAPSGAGKSTLLHVAGLLEKPDAGEVYVGASPTAAMGDPARTALRRTTIGFVYQFHHLLPEFTALENVALPQMIGGLDRREAGQRAGELLSFHAPGLLLADEPTGNLDPHTADHVFSTLTSLIRATGLAALIATHNMELAGRMDRRVTLHEGLVVELD